MSDMIDPRAEMLAKEIQMIVAAERWKGRNLSATPPEKWHRLRPETQQLWIDEASRILAALPPAPDAVEACSKCGGNREQWLRCSNFTCPGGDVFGRLPTTSSPDAVEALVKAEAALVEAKREMWIGARSQWTMEDFKNWAVIQQIDDALAALRALGGGA